MIAVLGAGPHGRQIAALPQFFEHRPELFDDNHSELPPLVVGYWDNRYLIGAAWPKVRRAIAAKAQSGRGRPWRDGVVIFPGAQIGNEVAVGSHTHIGWNAVVSHGCRVGSFVNICPGAVIAGEATIGDDVFIGANATIIHGGIKIGDGAVIGAGAVVLSDVPAGMTYAGNPARYLGVVA